MKVARSFLPSPDSVDRWSTVLARITSREAENIDDLVMEFDDRADPVGAAIFPEDVAPPLPRMDAVAMRSEDFAAIGYFVGAPLEDAADVATRLAMLALEKGVEIIVLTTLPYSGLERFGFRTERICGATDAERAACFEQLKTFWGLDVII